MSEASDGSESSSDSDFEEVEASAEDMARLTQLETSLSENSRQYEVHLQYIELLRNCKMAQRLKTARRAMQKLFPLSEDIWLQWLEDEQVVAQAAAKQQQMTELYQLALQDYLSIVLWTRYLRHLLEASDFTSQAGRDAFRDAAESALTIAGLHPSKGHDLWSLYRDAIRKYGPDEAIRATRSLFHRQLQVPLNSSTALLSEYESWEASISPDNPVQLPSHVRKGYEKAQEMLRNWRNSENAVADDKAADTDLLAAYMAYIQLEEAHGDPMRVQLLYERALAKFPVTHHLWVCYARYLETHVKLPDLVDSVYRRAVRNCPWVGALWSRSVRALHGGDATPEQLEELCNAGLQAGLQSFEEYLDLALARVDALRWKGPEHMDELRRGFQAAQEMIQTYFPDRTDGLLQLCAYWADCELRMSKDVSNARELWEAALKTSLGRSSQAWAAYIAMEVAAGNIQEAHTLYRRCHSRRMDDLNGQWSLCEAWLRFERELGSREDLLAAEVKVDPIREAAAAAATDAATAAAAKAAADKAPKLSKEEAKRLRQEKDPNFGKAKEKDKAQGKKGAAQKGKRKAPEAAQAEGQEGRQPRPDQADAAPAPAPVTTTQAHQHNLGTLREALTYLAEDKPDRTPPPPSTTPAPADAAPGKEVYSDEKTAFVRGLHPDVKKEDLADLFAECGDLKSVRVIYDRLTSQSKGFAYVEFGTHHALQRAVALLDGTELHGDVVVNQGDEVVTGAEEERVEAEAEAEGVHAQALVPILAGAQGLEEDQLPATHCHQCSSPGRLRVQAEALHCR
ncbi:hypothetical protein WJX73_006344 [Symbiochloris irregularis]|uniref:RRM domain-containing protein n=1 Tax=Symbiochloris irregularis TaxID=706552 RepID=A0AAW1PUG3_9CHLO